jgi:hypothetical protein
MGWNNPDPYNQPEAFGLTLIFDRDNGGPYEFDIFAVWQDVNGALYWAADAGCSCPSPFETFEDLSDLSYGSKEDIIAAMETWWSSTTDDKIALRIVLDAIS